MDKIVCNEHTEFYYNSYEELIKDIQNLFQRGYVIYYGDEVNTNRWMMYCKNIQDDETLQELKGSYFVVYNRNQNIVYEGYNDYRLISNKHKMVNLSEGDKIEIKSYFHDIEHNITKRNIGLIEAMDTSELKNLIELALIFKDKEWFDKLSGQLNKKLHNL